MAEDKKPRKKRICVDFDGTIVEHKFPAIGPVRKDVLKVLQNWRDKGAHIIISSARSAKMFGGKDSEKFKEMVAFIKKEGIPHDEIDDGTIGKVVADLYLDDRALNALDHPWRDLDIIINRKVFK